MMQPNDFWVTHWRGFHWQILTETLVHLPTQNSALSEWFFRVVQGDEFPVFALDEQDQNIFFLGLLTHSAEQIRWTFLKHMD